MEQIEDEVDIEDYTKTADLQKLFATHEMPIVSKKHKQLYLQDGNLIKITEQ